MRVLHGNFRLFGNRLGQPYLELLESMVAACVLQEGEDVPGAGMDFADVNVRGGCNCSGLGLGLESVSITR